MFDPRAIANEVLIRAWDAGRSVTQIDIQKIVYFLHGHHLRDTGMPLVDAEFEAWDYGPVQRVTYDAFKKFGDAPIDQLATRFDPVRRVDKEVGRVDDPDAISTIETYLERYLVLPSFELVEITHRRGTPWDRTRQDAYRTTNIGMRITDDTILSFFEGISDPNGVVASERPPKQST